jgi:predicted nucleic acid binding AN1-type Zn finger protein
MKKKCYYDGCNNKINKLMLITCKCRCDNYFCLKHNLPELHNCTFNFFTNEDKEKFIEDNKVIKKKISLI